MVFFIVLGVLSILIGLFGVILESPIHAVVFVGGGILLLVLTPLADRSERKALEARLDACVHAPRQVGDHLYHRYVGMRVEPPGPLGAVGAEGPNEDGVFVRIDGPTTDADLTGGILVVRLFESAPPPGSRVAFCGHALDPVYWWPRMGHQKGRGALYGPPDGPYAALRWIADSDSPPR